MINKMPPATPPSLEWVAGTVRQILVQPGEKFYVVAVRQAEGDTLFLRIGNAYTGMPLSGVTAENLVFDLLKEAYFRNLSVEVAYRNFGHDAQSGIDNLVIDRVSLSH
jgi:hypothetical protein